MSKGRPKEVKDLHNMTEQEFLFDPTSSEGEDDTIESKNQIKEQ